MLNQKFKVTLFVLLGLITLFMAVNSYGALPETGKNKVAYYTFDATPVGQGFQSLTTFTDSANIVVIFEGTLWELADTVHYNTGWMQNAVYSSKKQIFDDIQELRNRGIWVLMNVDDASSWSTATPFTTWDGIDYNYQQFAAFIYDCITTVGLDGISLDVEHGAIDNTHYRNLITELGSYFGPLSANPDSMIYTGAFYSGGAPGPIFRETVLSQYLNFVMDMAYFQNDESRFNYWADSLGNSKVMIGFSHHLNSLSRAIAHAEWHPAPEKAGIMVYAANVSKSYTDAIFTALGGGVNNAPNETGQPVPTEFSLQQNYPNPFNPITHISFSLLKATHVTITVYNIAGQQIIQLVNAEKAGGRYWIDWNGRDIYGQLVASGIYFYRMKAGNFTDVKKMFFAK